MSDWNIADVWEVAADVRPDTPVLVHGARRLGWRDFERRADGVARHLLARGCSTQDKVAQYLYNGTEYLESVFAALKAGLVPVNTNYRYVDDELVYLWDNADVVAVVFHGTFSERIDRLRPRLPLVHAWLWIDDGSGPCPRWATPYETAAAGQDPGPVTPPQGRSGDDLLLLYTGGTTGTPKGVMWRQDDLYNALSAALFKDPRQCDLGAARRRLAAMQPGQGPVLLCSPPLMHGMGLFTTIGALLEGGTVVTVPGRRFDAEAILDMIEAERVTRLSIVGDAYAKPLLAALDRHPGRWNLASLAMITSSGVMLSQPTKEGLLRHHPDVVIADIYGSSEAVGGGVALSRSGEAAPTARFRAGGRTRVLADDGRDVEPGSEEIGVIAVGGFQPVGYYKDPEKSARTFRIFDGRRYSIPGDYGTVEPDGTITVLGRGSVCINTGGEKVYPEEVEEVLKLHPAVIDAVVVGVPDERFGEIVVGLVERAPGAALDEADVIGHVKARLASYKAPKRILTVPTIGRTPSGKVDYRRLRAEATGRLAPEFPGTPVTVEP
ncbi:MAG TPA: AMP-binding protein [Acidimicrobiia bacterium]|nr:AMP-binding protein [Acidimicrobiia bacterium]